MTKALKKAEAATRPVRRVAAGKQETVTEHANPARAALTRAVNRAIAEGNPVVVNQPAAEAKPPRPTKFENAADKVLAWAKDHYESKTYAWHRLFETTTKAEIVAELEKENLWGEKAITFYRKRVKLWAEVDSGSTA